LRRRGHRIASFFDTRAFPMREARGSFSAQPNGMKAILSVVLMVVGLTTTIFAETQKCYVCDQPIKGRFYRAEDRVRGNKVDICTNCAALESRCFACGLPVMPDATKLADGRFLCARDAPEAILEDDEAKKICLETRDEMDRLYSRLTFPKTNVVLNIVDRFTLESLFKSPGYGQRCMSVFGATRSPEVGDRQSVHSISILSGLSKLKLEAVAAHEFGHAWLNENLRRERRASLAQDAIEAFCELIAYKLMDRREEQLEMKTIRENPYTRGQLEAFLAAEDRHGLNAVMEWMKFGEAAKLDAANPDSVRAVRAAGTTKLVYASAPLNFASLPSVLLPQKLVLKNVCGTAARRFAIINDRTFGTMDTAKVRLATGNVLVRCLEIRTNSVLIQIEGTGDKKELFLPGD